MLIRVTSMNCPRAASVMPIFWVAHQYLQSHLCGLLMNSVDHRASEMDVNGVVARRVLFATNKLKLM